MKTYLFLISLVALIVVSCEKDEPTSDNPSVVKDKITGLVQKGPYVSGTSVLMNELNSSLVQTGKIFSSNISNDLGLFTFNNIKLNSRFVEFSASGFYFNEIQGSISNAPLALSALSDIKDKSSINVNVLTHLEKKRVETLIKSGKSFSDAKTQSRNEVLSNFSISFNKSSAFEDFDISQNNEEGGILLAISVILQEGRTVGQLTELLSKIQNDLGGDGKLNSDTILTNLRIGTVSLDLPGIRKNIETRYKELNLTTPIPSFENYIINFAQLKNLNITIEGSGSVNEKIISNTSGKSYPKGMIVELTAVPEKGWSFDSWAGDLIGSENPTKVTVDAEKNITAKFKKINYPLNITIQGEGSVETTPSGTTYPYQTNVELKAVPKTGWVFDGWAGNLSGMQNPQSINMDSEKSVTAKFRQPIFKIAENGVTCKCENVKVGEMGMINGVEYEAVDNTSIRQKRDAGADMTKLCTSLVTDMNALFNEKSFNQPIGNWDVSNVTNMRLMFRKSSFNQPIGDWDVGKVTNMNEMFQFGSFNQPIGNWNVSNVTDMAFLFDKTAFNYPLENWNVSNVRYMAAMFKETPFNQPLANWDVSNVTSMVEMFRASSFNNPIGNWNVSNVTDMGGMFTNTPFNQPLANWDVSKVTQMWWMFLGTPFNQSIGNWNVINVKNMEGMFKSTPFNQALTEWNVSNVTSMGSMFESSNFNQPVDKWNVGNVVLMEFMFRASNFNQPLATWNVSNVISMEGMFRQSKFNQPIGEWNVINVRNMGAMFNGTPFNQVIGNWNVKNVSIMYWMFFDSQFNQDISRWCVSIIQNEPELFSSGSPLTPENKPVWGTCPQ